MHRKDFTLNDLSMKKTKGRVTMAEYVKAMKRVHREIELENSTGFKAVTKIHKSKKTYDRRESNRIDFENSPFLFV